MARSTRKSKKDDLAIFARLKSIFTSTQGFPIFLTLTVLAVMFVLFRMKSVEMDYQLADINREVDQVTLYNKELKAQRAQLLSVNRLRELASRHNFKQPRKDQIIVVP